MFKNPEARASIIRIAMLIFFLFIMSHHLFFENNHCVKISEKRTKAPDLTTFSYMSSVPFQRQVQEFIVKEKGIANTRWEEIRVLQWGKNPPEIGGDEFISGGAIPTEIWVDHKGDILIADGYGPRLLRFKENGSLRTFYDLKLLRPEHVHWVSALCGYRVATDIFGRWHILDQEKQKIFCYDEKGAWIKSWSIKNLLEDHYIIHDVHPVLQVVGKDIFHLKLTVSNPQDKVQQVLDNIPVRPSKIVALWVDACSGLVEEVSHHSSLFAYGYHTWELECLGKNKGAILQKERMKSEWILVKRWVFSDIPYNGGDLIGMDHKGRVYWWIDVDRIACLDTIDSTLQYLLLPKRGIYHPVAVHPSGGLVLVDVKGDHLSLFRLHLLPD